MQRAMRRLGPPMQSPSWHCAPQSYKEADKLQWVGYDKSGSQMTQKGASKCS